MKRLGMFLVLLSVSMFLASGCGDGKKKNDKKDDGTPPSFSTDGGGKDAPKK
ncbi:MAG: hypothetical protein JW741_10310 [Sedimentisphaerales bacterium]|nr:hypothetical protein [Sedimentisphaerales bacterium]